MNGTAIRPSAKKYRFAALGKIFVLSPRSGDCWRPRRLAVRFNAWSESARPERKEARDKPYPYIRYTICVGAGLVPALPVHQWPCTFAPGGGDQSNTPGGGGSL